MNSRPVVYLAIPRLLLLSALLSLLLASGLRCPAAGQTPVAFGTTAEGSITAAGQSDAWSFSARAGDVFLIRATRRSGNLWPRVQLVYNGLTVGEEAKPVMAELTKTFPVAGDCLIRVSDGFNGTFTGTYALFVQRVNDPEAAPPVEYGLTAGAVITLPGEMHTRTILAEPGDVIVARMSKVFGQVWPRVRVYGPGGQMVADAHQAVSVDTTVPATSEGTHTLVLGDGFDGTMTGGYNLFLQRVNRPDNAVPLPLGGRRMEVIDSPGVMRTFTVSPPADYDSPVLIRAKRTTGSLWPVVRLYHPDGTLAGEHRETQNTAMLASVPAGQTYTVLVGDGFNGTLTGSLSIGWNHTMTDVARSLRVAMGVLSPTPALRDRYNVVTSGPSAAAVDMADAVWIARDAAGL